MARKIQKLSPKTIEQRLNTWKTHFPEMYVEIEMLARESGVLTKTGKLSKAKRNMKKLQKFSEQFQTEYGSFTQFQKKEKQNYAQAVADGETSAISWKKYVQEKKDLNSLIHDLFDIFDNTDDAYAIYKDIRGATISEQRNFLNDTLKDIKNQKKKDEEKRKKQYKKKEDVEKLFSKNKPKKKKG